MDTLSRKHRLRQQEEQRTRAPPQTNQQVLYSTSEHNQQRNRFANTSSYKNNSNNYNSNNYNNNNNSISTNNNNNNGDNSDDHDEEQFKVFQVVELGNGLGGNGGVNQAAVVQVEPLRSASGERRPTSNRLLNGSKLSSSQAAQQIERRDKNDEVFSIVYLHQQQQPHQTPTAYSSSSLKRSSLSSSNNADSTGSTRSTTTGYSSGFQSEGSGPRTTGKSRPKAASQQQQQHHHHHHHHHHHQQQVRHQQHHHRHHTRVGRSRLIDDLDRLMGDANRLSANSPTDSYLSSAACSTGLPVNHELDYSTLCRDEFSSFISADQPLVEQLNTTNNNNNLSAGHLYQSGPVLVGVHHDARPQIEPAATPTSSEGSPEDCTASCSSSGCLSPSPTPSPTGELSPEEPWDDEGCDATEQLSATATEPTAVDDINYSIDNEDDLGHLLELHLSRVESLLRLARGDQSVSLREAFGGSDEQIEVSEEHRTQVEFTPIRQKPATSRVLQEICTVSMTIDEESSLDPDKEDTTCEVERHLCEDHFLSLLGSVQTSARLNWDLELSELDQVSSLSRRACCDNLVDTRRKRRLEESLLRHLLETDEAQDASSPDYHQIGNRNADYLVSTVKRHMSEFIDTYNNYQTQLVTQTSFGADWHQNWLFAYKRPNDETSDHQSEISSKRAKMASPGLDLIKYSTLVLSRCKPIKLTYPPIERWPTEKDKAEPVEMAELESCYLSQEERQEELERRSFESRHETDVCRLLLSDIFADQDSEMETGRKSEQRPLIVRYDCSSLPLSVNRLKFTAYGYLFALNGPVCSRLADDRRRLASLKVKILRRFEKLLTGPPSTRSLNPAGASEQVRFVIELSNVELMNKLPVIQICAKIDGSLPISVRWFRDGEEVSDISASTGRKSLRYRSDQRERSNLSSWPIELEANYDYEYQNRWASWYRFRRRQADILFEIREAKAEMDYGQRYRCVVQNYCSRAECSFMLKHREPVAVVGAPSERKLAASEKHQDGRALLRTWSQRTLHKPQPITEAGRKEVPGTSAIEKSDKTEEEERFKSWKQTVGRRSALAETDEVKFGPDFPYHPENLLKRLEENKFCLKLNCKTLTKSRQEVQVGPTDAKEAAAAADVSSPSLFEVEESTTEVVEKAATAAATNAEPQRREPLTDLSNVVDEDQLTSPSAEQQRRLQSSRQSQQQQLHPPTAENSDERQQVRVEVQPKPRSRLRVAPVSEPDERMEPASRFAGANGLANVERRQQVCADQQAQQVEVRSTPHSATAGRQQQQQQQQPRLVSQRLNDIGKTTSAASKPDIMPKPTIEDWIPKANVKSLISRFS